MRRKTVITIAIWGSVCLLAVIFSACVTVPSGGMQYSGRGDPLAALESAGEFGGLAPGASVYMAVDVQAVRPVLSLLTIGNMGVDQTGELLDKTARAACALYPQGAERRFLAAAQGEYPNALAALALTASADWQKMHAWNNAPYWRSESGAVSLALNKTRALVSDGEPFARNDGSAAPVSTPEGFDTARSDAPIAGWIADGGASLNKLLAMLEIPIELEDATGFFFVRRAIIDSAGAAGAGLGGYEVHLRVSFPTEEQAKGIITLFSLAQLFIGENSQSSLAVPALAEPLLGTASSERTGSAVILHSGAMTAEETALLFNTFAQCF